MGPIHPWVTRNAAFISSHLADWSRESAWDARLGMALIILRLIYGETQFVTGEVMNTSWQIALDDGLEAAITFYRPLKNVLTRTQY